MTKRVIKFKLLPYAFYLLAVGTFTSFFTLKAMHKQPQKKRLGSGSIKIILDPYTAGLQSNGFYVSAERSLPR